MPKHDAEIAATLAALDAELVNAPLQVDSEGALWARLKPGSGATDVGKAEDAAHASGDTGIYILAVRDDVLAAHSGTDGDYESLHTDAEGALWVRESGVQAPVAATGTSGANAAQTVSTLSTGPRRILYVTAAYSAAPTQTGVTVTINSVAGAGFDTLISTGAANAQYTFYQPSEPLILQAGDTLDVTAPAGGGVITSSVLIVSQE